MKKLIILEIANNHGGILEEGLKIINDFESVIKTYNTFFDFAFKFQFRNLDTFIHPDYKDRDDIKYVERFKKTKLTEEDFRILKNKAEEIGCLTICTGFDEPSVDLIQKMNFDYIKIASCSFTDWPLLNKIVESTDLPIIASTAGSSLDDIDKVVSFFSNRNRNLSLLQCTGEYPTKPENLQLNQIKLLKNRYPNLRIGLSSHEEPDETTFGSLALAMGAEILERHVTICPVNKYSTNSQYFRTWMQNNYHALRACGTECDRPESSKKEQSDLRTFKRGVFLKRDIEVGENITRDDVFYAFPCSEGQILANDMSKYFQLRAKTKMSKNQALNFKNFDHTNEREHVYKIVQKVKKLIAKSGAIVPNNSILELSHHYGINRIEDYGLAIITTINREYCKKLLISLPKQGHPEQLHKKKEETFLVLYGKVTLCLDGKISILSPGDIVTITPGVKHFFVSQTGSVIEELSSTHYKDDSYYTDDDVRKDRKTIVNYWE